MCHGNCGLKGDAGQDDAIRPPPKVSYDTSGVHHEKYLPGHTQADMKLQDRHEDVKDRVTPRDSHSPLNAAIGAGDQAGGAGATIVSETTLERHGRASGSGDFMATFYLKQEAAELKGLVLPGGGSVVQTQMEHKFKTGAVYDGQWLNNIRDGTGRQTWPDGAEYHGEWKQNCAQGRGYFKHADGDIYIGQWRDNMVHGVGSYHHRDQGITYSGTFVNDAQEGVGVEGWPDNSKYRGQFSSGKKSGHGVYEWPDGSQYEGQWVDNRIDGLGTYTGVDGRRYTGRWQRSTMHGLGKYQWSDGRHYEGQYVWDQKDGFGIFTWADGRKYEGFWKAGRQNGFGRLCAASGSSRLAEWENGNRVRWVDPEKDMSGQQGHHAVAPKEAHSQ